MLTLKWCLVATTREQIRRSRAKVAFASGEYVSEYVGGFDTCQTPVEPLKLDAKVHGSQIRFSCFEDVASGLLFRNGHVIPAPCCVLVLTAFADRAGY